MTVLLEYIDLFNLNHKIFGRSWPSSILGFTLPHIWFIAKYTAKCTLFEFVPVLVMLSILLFAFTFLLFYTRISPLWLFNWNILPIMLENFPVMLVLRFIAFSPYCIINSSLAKIIYGTAQRQLDTHRLAAGWILLGEDYIMRSIFEQAPVTFVPTSGKLSGMCTHEHYIILYKLKWML